ncbi:TPA: DegT/DnrJ/EryC1/StrS family aminotransferase [Escherichia coli]|uniref:DegT/DnrJ/EryC1/StrS family aminotransferase n=1 Tax=Escherichia coli TaxID=562 RepID=UPI000DD93381|nr:DegT/DnrJ/EryC1/StrS family aminotransferase [Escherichia coli]MCF6591129.1 DegT/DnrJ/EryC1/StrS family aminotransferase [Escherichia coli]MDF9132153.1 DegT/DnrJ/EryC1/StrS family aminotransferase [Escherichia coli]MED8101050.1 DegT/DnrJ/EryC1/StrS family aminotransferase [Escherichia coli]TGH05166.1 DegT/DnrJ/EryC1/StrS family aminotransferase [Escherichia coli]HBB0743046.1 DegT/DnrJ/EryC1/StrS family aminotransferase [Escherichia coli]
MLPLVKVGMPDKDILIPRIEEVLYSGFIAEGEAVYEFERRFGEHFSLGDNVLGMYSGTAALHTALILAGVKEGDEVITTSMTAEPTNLSILQAGGKPVFADVDVFSGNLSPESIKEKITSKTKAILVVHYAGIPVRLKEISKLAKENGLKLIEDCAHALGSSYDGLGIGQFGDYSIFSLQAIKHMTTVDGGILYIKDNEQIKRAKKIRWFGMEKGVARTEVDITELGYKYNMHNVAACIGLAQLQCVQERIQRHIDNGRYFDSVITKIPGLDVPKFDAVASPSYWLYTIFSDDSDDIQRKLDEVGVMASKLHKPNHTHAIFSNENIKLPNLEHYYEKMIHIPCGWWVDNEAREMIVEALKKG